MFSGALARIAELRFVLAHGGGYLPYQSGGSRMVMRCARSRT